MTTPQLTPPPLPPPAVQPPLPSVLGFYPTPTPYRGQAIASLVLGIVGIFTGIPAILAIIFGAIALRGCKRLGAPKPGMAVAGLTLGIVAIPLWALLAVVGAFADSTDGSVGVFSLQVGDCLELDHESSQITDIPAVACDVQHSGEVVAVSDSYFTGDMFPGQEQLFSDAESYCVRQLDRYTGTTYDTSNFEAYFLVPTSESWNQGDRGLTCIGMTLDATLNNVIQSTGSIRNR